MKHAARLGGVLLLAGLIALAQHRLNDYHLRLLNVAGINAILAASLNLTNGLTGIFSLGHAGFMAVGAYAGTLLTFPVARKEMMIPDLPQWLGRTEWPFFPALLAGGLFAALCAAIVGWPVLRLRGHYLAVATLGFMIIVQVVATNLDPYTRGALGINGIPPYTSLWWVIGTVAGTLYVNWAILHSKIGRAFRALREDDLAAQAVGIRLARYRLAALVVGAFFAGMAGALWAHLITVISPAAFSFLLTFQIVVMVVVGGTGSLTGAVIAATLLTLLPEATRGIEQGFALGPWEIPSLFGVSQIIMALLLILVMFYRPQGLFGSQEITWEGIVRRFSGTPLYRRKAKPLDEGG